MEKNQKNRNTIPKTKKKAKKNEILKNQKKIQKMIFEWLERIGLSYAIEKFKLHGIDTAKKLQNIRVCEYDELGVKDESDRKKLFALITKIRNVVAAETKSNKDKEEVDESKVSTPVVTKPSE